MLQRHRFVRWQLENTIYSRAVATVTVNLGALLCCSSLGTGGG